MARHIKQRIDLGNGDALRAIGDFYNLVAFTDLAFLDNAKIKAGSMMGDEQRGHLRVAHPNADAITGDPRLADLEQSISDSVTIADADLIVGKAIDCEVFAELAILEVMSAKQRLPISVRFELIHHYGTIYSTMPR